MGVKLSNNATSTLASSITDVATSLSVQTGDAALFPSLSGTEWFPLTVINTSGNYEVMRATARTGAVITVTRAQEGTTAIAFDAGSRVDLRLTATAAAALPEAAVNDASTKTTPVDADQIVMVDSAASSALKRLTWANLKAQATQEALDESSAKTLPVGADLIPLLDTEDSQSLKKVTWATIRNQYENKLLNSGGFYLQRGSLSVAASTSKFVFDRYYVTNNTNQTVIVSKNSLSLGGGFTPGGSRFTMRYSFASAPTSGTLRISQQISGVTSVPGGDWTFTAYMTGPSGTETLAAEAVQHFGTGGSPSADVTTAMTFAANSPTSIYDASTKRRAWGVTIPSMAGKVLGTGVNDYLDVALVLTPRQASNYDITWLSFVSGDATSDEDPNYKFDPDLDLILCQRYFSKSYRLTTSPGGAESAGATLFNFAKASSLQNFVTVRLPVSMRDSPTLTAYNPEDGTSGEYYNYSTSNAYAASVSGQSESFFRMTPTASTGVNLGDIAGFHWTADAELK